MAFHYDWPDYVHNDYGVPLLWAIHTESAITGPVDIWRVNPTNLVANVAIWTVLSQRAWYLSTRNTSVMQEEGANTLTEYGKFEITAVNRACQENVSYVWTD